MRYNVICDESDEEGEISSNKVPSLDDLERQILGKEPVDAARELTRAFKMSEKTRQEREEKELKDRRLQARMPKAPAANPSWRAPVANASWRRPLPQSSVPPAISKPRDTERKYQNSYPNGRYKIPVKRPENRGPVGSLLGQTKEEEEARRAAKRVPHEAINITDMRSRGSRVPLQSTGGSLAHIHPSLAEVKRR
ncbi:MAG: hypothetical protein ACKVI4_16480 [Actinomycetales bacterium]